jgi:hypothetical protein
MEPSAQPALERSLPKPAFRVVGRASAWLTGVGFVGLWLCKQVREHQRFSEQQFLQTIGGGLAVFFFSACFILGLVVLFPLSLHLQKRAGVPLPGPGVPGWMAWPLRILLVGGFCLLLLILLGLAVSSL